MKGVIALIVVACALAAAVPASAGTPTKASWAAAANSTCRVAYARIRKLPKATTPALFLADARATLRIATPMDSRVAAIPRPAGERAQIAALVANSRAQEPLFQKLIQALARGDGVTAQGIVKKLGPIGDRYNRLALALGATVCAENPQPSG
jgi:hypothetical protein